MAFLETRGMLAKLLATENIVVEHDSSSRTAAFDTLNRVLKLPVFKTENENVYNMLVGHEVGHALETPTHWRDDLPENVPADFINVIEDVRIEKFIQSKFPGLRVDFTKGYDELNEQDFFAIRDKDLSKFSLIDRINLHFKLGVRALIPFTEEELVYVNAVDDCDTWQKVVLAAKMLSDYVNSKASSSELDDEQLSGNSDGKDEENQQEEQSKTSQSRDNGDESDDNESESESDIKTDVDNQQSASNETVSQTQRSFDESLKDIADSGQEMNDIIYINVGDVNPDQNIVDVKTLRESFVEPNISETSLANTGQWIRQELDQFLKSIRADVNHMVQQFEMKKSADAYARQQVNKTGVLDTNLLHSYKLTDDIFLRQNVTPDGKNHGMVMYLDWSGSMSDICIETVKQIITLVQFCRKVQIPFDVYTFTSGSVDSYDPDDLSLKSTVSHCVTQLVQVLTSSAKKKEIDQDIFNLYSQALVIGKSVRYNYSPYMSMAGTPLNNALFLVPSIIERFRQKTGAQKVSFVCVTDGESAPLQFYETRKIYDGSLSIRIGYAYYQKLMIRSGVNVFPISNEERGTPDVVRWLKTQLEDVSITHLFLAGLKGCDSYIRGITNYSKRLDEKVFRKEGCHATTTDSWPLVGLINPKSFTDADDDIQVNDGASKTQIKSALKKYLKSKTSSRVVLNQLVGQFS
jgi:hypothetical protein